MPVVDKPTDSLADRVAATKVIDFNTARARLCDSSAPPGVSLLPAHGERQHE
jgi:hypothetical protein